MRNLLLVISIILILPGCQRALGFYGSYDYSFVGVSDNELKDTLSVSNTVYSDSLITMRWRMDLRYLFHFDLENKTDENIEIDWRKVSFITPSGQIVRSVVDFASFIPPKSHLSDFMRWERFRPWGLANFEDIDYHVWFTYRAIEIRPTYYIEVRDSWKDFLGTRFSVYFPMRIKGKEYNYRFIFEADGLNVRQQAPNAAYSVGIGEDFPEGYRTLKEIRDGHKGRIRVVKDFPALNREEDDD